MQYYVYIYYDPRTNLPFYVGKGKNKRCYDHLSETIENTSNKYKYSKIQAILNAGLEPMIIIDSYFKNEEDAYDYEESLILKWGRKGYEENGILCNVRMGNNPPTHKGFKHSDETKAKMSKARKGVPLTFTVWNKGLYGYSIHTDEYKKILQEKMSQTFIERYGEERSQEIKYKMSVAHKGKSFEERFGENADNIKERISSKMKGKSLEELLGVEQASEGREIRRLNAYNNEGLQRHKFCKGNVPWNKGRTKHTDKQCPICKSSYRSNAATCSYSCGHILRKLKR